MNLWKLSVGIFAAVKSVWTRGSPFAALTALWPTNEESKFIIQSEGIRLAFTNHGAAVTNLWLNNTYGEEIDVVLGLDDARDYPALQSNPFLNGVIGMLSKSIFHLALLIILPRFSNFNTNWAAFTNIRSVFRLPKQLQLPSRWNNLPRNAKCTQQHLAFQRRR